VLTLGRVFAPVTFLAFIAGEAPAVAAAGLFEFGVLLARARRRGLPLVNLFSGAWWATGVAVPGVIIAGAPLALFQTFIGRAPLPALGAMGLLSVLELGAALGVVLALVRGGR
ncbi:MAG TPA: hypothetical protein VLX64_05765, partial [Thermoplasmata archaeon]|nr:hypothetical protein [Thermoplasmata archaeon]